MPRRARHSGRSPCLRSGSSSTKSLRARIASTWSARNRDASNSVIGHTIVALEAGKVVWTVDDPDLGLLPKLKTNGDDLVAIAQNKIRVYAAANGKVAKWEANWNANPILSEGVVYATPATRRIEAYDVHTGAKRWSTQLPVDTRVPHLQALGSVRDIVYLEDGAQLRSFDAKTGKLLGSCGVAKADSVLVHTGTPAITMCDGGSVVALDPSSKQTAEQRVTLTGRIVCKNCTRETTLEVHVGDAVVTLGADRKLSLEVSARGKHWLTVRDTDFSGATQVKPISFDATRALPLGDLQVKVPAPGD